MTEWQQPFDAEKFRASLEQATAGMRAAFTSMGNVLITQGAMGWIFKGDLERARTELEKLPVDKLVEVSAAAAALSSLADEVTEDKS